MATTTLTPAEFKVDMAQFAQAITTVSQDRDTIEADITQLKALFTQVEQAWISPSGATFIAVQDKFNSAVDELSTLLNQMIQRMQTTYNNYLVAETKNYNNLT